MKLSSIELELAIGYLATVELFSGYDTVKIQQIEANDDKHRIYTASYKLQHYEFTEENVELSYEMIEDRRISIELFMACLEVIYFHGENFNEFKLLLETAKNIVFGKSLQANYERRSSFKERQYENILNRQSIRHNVTVAPTRIWQLQEIQFDDSGRWVSNWFSNMIVDRFEYNGRLLKSVENAYQASKCYYGHEAEMIAELEPHQAKHKIKLLKHQEDFKYLKLLIMYKFLRAKFRKRQWRELLDATGDDEIVEFNNWNDSFWGADYKTGNGSNFLGLMLMKIRSDCRFTV